MTLGERYDLFRRGLAVLEAETRAAREQAASATTRADEASKEADLCEGAREVLIALAKIKQSEVSARVEGLVTKALRSVFGREDYEFKFLWDEKRGQATATPVLLTRHGEEVLETDILDGHGGGIVDVVAFVLRFIIAKHTPGLLPILVYDEPFRHVAEEHAEGVGVLLNLLSAKTGWRFLIVTHQKRIVLNADRMYRVVLDPETGRSMVVDETARFSLLK